MDSERIAEIQSIIKRGCASGKPYPWCGENDKCEGRACWYQEAKAIVDAGYTRPVEPVPELTLLNTNPHVYDTSLEGINLKQIYERGKIDQLAHDQQTIKEG